ncbi:hypothetical protein ACVBGC_32635 [Burkholderia stagnalis]
MTENDKSAAILSERHANLNRDIAMLESMVKVALESLHHVSIRFARIAALARYAASAEMNDEDRLSVMKAAQELSEEAERESRDRGDKLRLTASRYWVAKYGGDSTRRH